MVCRLSAAAALLALAACAPRSRDIVFAQSAGAPALAVDGEIELGRQIERAVLDRLGVQIDNDAERARRLQQSFERLGRLSERPNLPWRIHIVTAPSVNAVALPGGALLVTTGLLAQVGESELRAVFAHEIGHLSLGHLANRITVEEGVEQVLRRLRDVPREHTFTPIEEARAERAASRILTTARADVDTRRLWLAMRHACTPESPGYVHDHGLESWAGLRDLGHDTLVVPDRQAPEEKKAAPVACEGAVQLRGVCHSTVKGGQQVYAFEVQNGSARTLRRVAVTLRYLDAKDHVVYEDNGVLSSVASGETKQSSFVIKAADYVNLKLVIGEIAYE